MIFRGEQVSSKAVYDVLSKYKKDKKYFLHIALTYHQGNEMCSHTLSCVLYNYQACSVNRKTGTNMYTFNTERMFNFYCHGAHN